jgi:hypothetical protein
VIEIGFLSKDVAMPASEVPMFEDDYVFVTM